MQITIALCSDPPFLYLIIELHLLLRQGTLRSLNISLVCYTSSMLEPALLSLLFHQLLYSLDNDFSLLPYAHFLDVFKAEAELFVQVA